jgi:hypothetical protein
MTDSGAKAILIAPDPLPAIAASARKLGIGIVSDINACLEILDQATVAQTNPTLLRRLATMVGWK